MINIIEVNIQIMALTRLSDYYYHKIEAWEEQDPCPKEELAFLQARYDAIQERMVELLTLKSEANLPI